MVKHYEEKDLFNLIEKIEKPDESVRELSWAHWDKIAKPLRSLGKLEKVTVDIAAIQNDVQVDISKKALVIMCADNGVVAEGVTQAGQEVTAIVSENFLDEKSCAAIMCSMTGTSIHPIDIGMAVDTPRVEKRKIGYATKNMAIEPAMTRSQAIDAIFVGIDKASELASDGVKLLAVGEMGIGNTTSSSAITAVLLGEAVEAVTGRGAGLSSEGLVKKIDAIKRAIDINRPEASDPIDVLSKVGGFDIAGIAGVIIGAASNRIPVVIDGFITAVAALVAVRIAPVANEYIIASHLSKEPATVMVMEALGKDIMLDCDMHLGEGTGAVALFPMLDMAAEIYKRMSSFEEIKVEQYEHLK